MRSSRRHVLCCVAFSLAVPLGAGCKGSGGFDVSGTGGATDPSTGDIPNEVGVGAGGDIQLPVGVWLHHYGDAEDQHASAVAVNDDGDIALTGTARGTIDFGNIPWTGSPTDSDVFVTKISSEGQAQWSRRYGDSCDQRGGAVANAPSGNVVVAGTFCGKMRFGNTSVEAATGEVDAFVAMIDTLGEDVYSRSFGGAGAQVARGVAVDTKGNTILVGSFDGSFDDGTAEVQSAGMDDAFVIKLDPAGKVLWSRAFGGAESDLVRGVAVDAADNIVLGGSFGAAVDFGGGPVAAIAGHSSGFVLELDPEGKHLWSRTFGVDDEAAVTGVAVRPGGNVAATGYFKGSIDLGSGAEASAGDEDAFVVTMAVDGTPAWGHTLGAAGSQRATGVTFDVHGDVAISGTSDSTLDLMLGGGVALSTPFVPAGPYMTYAVTFNSASTPTRAWVIDSASGIEGAGIGFDRTLGTVLAGSYQASIDFEGTPVVTKGGWDVFLARTQ